MSRTNVREKRRTRLEPTEARLNYANPLFPLDFSSYRQTRRAHKTQSIASQHLASRECNTCIHVRTCVCLLVCSPHVSIYNKISVSRSEPPARNWLGHWFLSFSFFLFFYSSYSVFPRAIRFSNRAFLSYPSSPPSRVMILLLHAPSLYLTSPFLPPPPIRSRHSQRPSRSTIPCTAYGSNLRQRKRRELWKFPCC